MKLGTSIFLLVIILIAFGYVLSDDHHIRKDLTEALVQMEGLNIQFVDVNEKLNSCQKTVQDDQQMISQQRTEIASLNNVITVKENEIGSLQTVISQQTGRIIELEGTLVTSAEEKNKLRPIQSAGTWLQLNPMALAVLLLTELILFIIQRRQKNGYMRLSGEERALIIKLRRMKKM